MKNKITALAAAACVLLAGSLWSQQPDQDPLLRAMKEELDRSRMLRIVGLDQPYFIEYRVADETNFSVNASLGGLVSSGTSAVRFPVVKVRIGDYRFDNTNHVLSDAYSGSRYDSGQLPLENSYLAFRQIFWLATDRSYKTAEDAIARKRASLKNVNVVDPLPDFSKEPPQKALLPIRRVPVNETAWKDRVVRLSAVFSEYPKVIASAVELQISQATNYLVNSEGTELRTPENLAFVRVLARGEAADGTPIRDASVIQAFDADSLPPEAELLRQTSEVAKNVSALVQAPVAEYYDGPVLFEAPAAAQLFGQLLGDSLKVTRKPVTDPGRTPPYLPSDLENRVGFTIMPEWMDVVDDPTQTDWHGHTLLGHYLFDIEGVKAEPLSLVDKGVLRNFLLTRTPVFKSFENSNGRARFSGAFGADAPGFGNLFVRANKTVSFGELKKKMMDLCRDRNRPYGVIIRKLDFPSTASIDEFRRMLTSMSQSGAGTRPIALPLLVYRVYQDGREELVRGLRFRNLSTRTLRDILAASDENYVFDFVDSNAPLALIGAGNYVTSASVISPSILFDEVELEPIQEETQKPPIVPPPPLIPETTRKAQSRSPGAHLPAGF